MQTGSRSQTQSLAGSEDYFLNVLKPNKEAFFGSPSTFASALNLATALFHFHEWLFVEFQPQLESHFQKKFGSSGAFWQAVEQSNQKFGYIRDVANASKHVRIGEKAKPRPSIGMSHIANTYIVWVGYGQGSYGLGRYGGGPNVVVSDGGTEISFDDCAQELFNFWKTLLEKLTENDYS